MAKRIVLTGATGLIGTELYGALTARGDSVTVLARNPGNGKIRFPDAEQVLLWAPGLKGSWPNALENADAVIHLAGEAIGGQRWTEKYKKRILESRVIGTGDIVTAMKSLRNPPAVFISASGVGYYGDSGNDFVTETSPPGKDFVSHVCVQWEKAATAASEFGSRVVIPRIGLVLSKKGGVLRKLHPLFRNSLGGRLGNGKQWFPWIHISDLTGIILHVLDDPGIAGPVNATAPEPVRQKQFATELGMALGRPAILPVPGFMLRLLLGEFAGSLLTGQRPSKSSIIGNGYNFLFPEIAGALNDIYGTPGSS